MTKRIIVTGATSFLGASLIEGLIGNNYNVYSIVRPNSTNKGNILKHKNNLIIYEDLENIYNITEAIDSADVFIHFGWDGIGSKGRSNKDIQNNNIENSLKALKVAKKLGCHTFIFSGSQAEYGMQIDMIKETNQCSPISEYGKAKLKFGELAKEFCSKNKIRFFHLRIFSVYGLKDHPWTLVNSCIDAFETGKEIALGACEQYWNYMYITDFVDVFIQLIESTIETEYYILNVASDDTRKLKEYVEEIFVNTRQKGKYLLGTRGENAEGATNLRPDIEKIKSLLNWKPKVAFSTGIKYIVESKRKIDNV